MSEEMSKKISLNKTFSMISTMGRRPDLLIPIFQASKIKENRRMQSTGYQNSVLDTKPSRVLSFPLTVRQQLWLSFLLPVIVTSTFYIVDIATDLTIGIQLLEEKHIWAGLTTIGITYLAPIICYIMHLINPPPENEFSKLFMWFLSETLALIFYPIRPLQCFAEKLFWAIESMRHEDPQRENSLIEYEKTHSFVIENYLFMQGMIHSGPQAIFQLTLLIFGVSTEMHTQIFQAIGVITSLLTLSLITTSYQRYETQVKGSRKRVWYVVEDTLDGDEPRDLLYASGTQDALPRRRSWTKVMDEDNPVGKLCSFLFWFLFLFGRCVCLVMASLFFPWAVIGVCATHYVIMFIYILPTPNCRTNIVQKMLLSFIFIFCLIEVGIRFRKSQLFHCLFIMFCLVENLSLTLLWSVWANWDNWWYFYSLYLMGITHVMSLLFLIIYIKLFKPSITRVQPNM